MYYFFFSNPPDIQEVITEYCRTINAKIILDEAENVYCIPPEMDIITKEK